MAQRQFVKYSFYKVAPEWRGLPKADRLAQKREFSQIVNEAAERMMVLPYTTVGYRGDVDFLLWEVSERLEDIQELTTRLYATGFGPYLTMPYSYLAMTKRSMYVENHVHEGQEGRRTKVRPIGSKYLFVYPFVKTRPWYMLSKDERQRMMDVHIQTGHKYPSVRLNTSYSFGLDDQEFMVAFETDSPSDFLDLVMELRETEASSYTMRDTPIFTCQSMSIEETLDTLGG